jgi:vacuolar-type H+-ATPase subunit E/Vma4
MTIAPLLGQLRETARAEADHRLENARAQAARLVDVASDRLARQHAAAMADRSASWSRDRERHVASAREAAARATLAAGEALVARVLRATVEQAAEWRDSDAAAAWLRRTVEDGAGFLPDGPVTVRTTLEPAWVGPLAGRTVQVVPGESSLGVVLVSAGRDVLVDATLERFVVAERARLAQAILARSEHGP